MKLIKLSIVLISFVFAAYAQENKLPIIKSNVNVISIQDGDVFKKITTPRLMQPDIYETTVKKGSKKKVTFITDLDKISFDVEAGKPTILLFKKAKR